MNKRRTLTSHKTYYVVCLLYILIHMLSPVPAYGAENISLQVEPSTVLVSIPTVGSQTDAVFELTNLSDHPQVVTFEVFPIEKIDKNTNRLIYQSKSNLSEVEQSFYENAISILIENKTASEVLLSPKQTVPISLRIQYDSIQSISNYNFTLGFIGDRSVNKLSTQKDEIQATLDIRGGIGSHVLVSFGDKHVTTTLQDIIFSTSTASEPNVSFTLINSPQRSNKVYGSISIKNILGMEIASGVTGSVYLLPNQEKVTEVTLKKTVPSLIYMFLSLGPLDTHIDLHEVSQDSTMSYKATHLNIPLKALIFVTAFIFVLFLIQRKIKEKLNV